MGTGIGRWTGIPLLVVLGLSAGCARPSAHYGVETRDAGWAMVTADSVGGIDIGTVAVVTLKSPPAEIHRLVIWGDVSGSRSSAQSNQAGAGYHNTLVTSDKRKIAVTAVMQRGRPGYVQIDDARYRLTDGTIFLVSTANNKVTVKQLQGGVEAFTSLPELKLPQVQELLKSQPAIREFFETQHAKAEAQ